MWDADLGKFTTSHHEHYSYEMYGESQNTGAQGAYEGVIRRKLASGTRPPILDMYLCM